MSSRAPTETMGSPHRSRLRGFVYLASFVISNYGWRKGAFMKWSVWTLLWSLAGVLVIPIALGGQGAQASQATLWYNGNRDNRDAVTNQTSSTSGGFDGRVYDDFIVPIGQVWTITSVFSNNVRNPFFTIAAPTTASWESRSGVSAGNGGTLVASGDGADVHTATGRTSTVFAPFSATEFDDKVNGLNVILGAGRYWLSVAPDTNGTIDAAWNISTTSGASAVGTPPGNNGNSFFSSTFTGDSFSPTATSAELGVP